MAPSRGRISFSSKVKDQNEIFKFICGSFFFGGGGGGNAQFSASGIFNIGMKWVKVGYAR